MRQFCSGKRQLKAASEQSNERTAWLPTEDGDAGDGDGSGGGRGSGPPGFPRRIGMLATATAVVAVEVVVVEK